MRESAVLFHSRFGLEGHLLGHQCGSARGDIERNFHQFTGDTAMLAGVDDAALKQRLFALASAEAA
jgi:hypothetical protein